jgi:hypothetical protein
MKKSLFVLIPVILIGTQVFAQENSEDCGGGGGGRAPGRRGFAP